MDQQFWRVWIVTSEHGIESSHKPIYLVDIICEILRAKFHVLATSLVFAVLGVIIGAVVPVKYTATSKIMVPQQTPSAALMIGVGAGVTSSVSTLSNLGLGKNPADIYLGIMETRPVQLDIVKQLNLRTVYNSKTDDQARHTLENLTLIESGKDNLISVSYTDKDKYLAAQVANAYPDSLRKALKDVAATEAARRRKFYEEQLREAKGELIKAEQEFSKIQSTKGLVIPEMQSRSVVEGITSLRAQITAKELQIHSLRSYSSQQSPDLKLAEGQLAALNGEMQKMERQNKTAESGKLGLADVQQAGLEYIRASRELGYRQSLYDMLVKQLEIARLDEAKEGAVVQVVEPAIVPEFKTQPHKLKILAEFVFLGVFLSIVGILCRMLYRGWMSDSSKRSQILMIKKELLRIR